MRALLVLGVAAALVAVAPCASGEPAAARHHTAARVGHVDYAVDGDTLRVELADGELVYVRLVGRLPRVSSPTLRAPAVAIG